MKTKTVIVCLISGFLAVAQPAWSAPRSFESRQHARQTRRPATLATREVSGVIPRAVRGGNALQMLNPSAPAKYGTANESVSIDPDVPGKVNGIIFVSVPF
ncbi:MAG: hypothetical protein QOD64_177 [Verrucomicrobiota bacterium]